METTDKLSRSVIILAFAVSAFVLSLPFWMPINGHDGWIHLNWLEQFTGLFRDGELYPHWMPDSFSGFGSPAFYVYPPFTYWIASTLSLIGLLSGESLFYGMTLAVIVASGVSFYYFARGSRLTPQGALMGALCYSLAPYVMIDVAIRNALSEHTAFIWLPLIFIGIEWWIVRNETERRRVIGAALFITGLSCLLLTNIPVFVVSIITSAVYILCCNSDRSVIKRLLLCSVGIVAVSFMTLFYTGTAREIGGCLSISKIWDILQGKPVHRWMLGIGEEYQHFRDFFLALSFMTSLVLFLFVNKKLREREMWRFVVTLFALGILFQLPYLTDILNELPIIKYIQFDQRWNVVLVFASAISIMMLFEAGSKYVMKITAAILIIAGSVPISVAVFFSNPPSRFVVEKYHNDPPEYISKYVENTSIKSPEYFTLTGMTQFIEGSDSLSWKKLRPSVYEIVKIGENEVIVRFRLQYFPFWWLSEPRMQSVKLYPDSDGLLTAHLPKGKGRYYLQHIVSGSGTYSLLSIVSIPLILFVLLLFYYRDKALQLLRKVNKFFHCGF